MRAIAVIIVIFSHGGWGHIIPGGFGVTIFFFLSGYLITTLLRNEREQTDTIDFRGFYFRRVARIFPPMYIAIALACLLSVAGLQPERIIYRNLISDFAFLTNYAQLFGGHSAIRIPLWSLDIEEHFYILFPALYLFLCRKLPNSLSALICLGICLCVLAMRISNAFVLEDYSNNYYWTHTRIDSILFGCSLALWNNPTVDKRDFFRFRWLSGLLAFLLLMSAFLVRDPFFRETWRYTIQGAGLFFMFNFVIRDKGIIDKFLAMKILKIIALLSYTLYLVHLPIFLCVDILMPDAPRILQFVTGSALSFIFASAVYIMIERPVAKWRKKIEAGWRSRKNAVG